jgi:hypothetical protein
MMADLKQIQDSFQQYLLQSDARVIVSQVVSTETLPAITRLSIYGDAYRSRLFEALASNYPFLHACVGDDEFYALAMNYINQHPSNYRSIRWYGDRMQEFIQQNDYSQLSPSIHEVAALDWMMTLVFDAKDTEVVTLEQMALIPADAWADMHFAFHPSFHRLQFNWNVIEFWQSTLSEDGQVLLSKYSSPVTWIFWRHDLINHFISMSNDEDWALSAAIEGSSFSDICEGLCQFMPEENVAIAAASMLKKWIASGLISTLSY